jgi:hypothetical protein
MNTKRFLPPALAMVLVALVFIAAALAASPSMRWFLVDSGGGYVQGGQYGLASAIGQPVSGRVSNGYTLHSGLYLGHPSITPADRYVFLPMVMDEPCMGFAGPREKEPNDAPGHANGPLCSGIRYLGSPDSHGSSRDDDWYSFDWSGNGTITIELENFLTIGQLLLFRDPNAGYLDRDYDQADGHYTISYTGAGQSGTYYIMVFAPDGHPTGNGDYTLSFE